ncbi:MAG: hypothetical protein AB8H79_07505 [Myxococcota bacterium]
MARSRRRSTAPKSVQKASPAPSPALAGPAPTFEEAPACEEVGPTLAGFAAQLGLDSPPPVDETSGRAGSMGAAAVAQNGGVAVNPDVMGAGADLAPLMAHEAVHLAQAKVDGPEAAEADLETEADEGAAALLQGKPFQPQHATKGQRPLKKGLADWFSEATAEWYSKWEEEPERHVDAWKEGRLDKTWEREAETLPSTDRSTAVTRDGIRSERDTYVGTNEVVEDANNPWAEPKRRQVSGTKLEHDGTVVEGGNVDPEAKPNKAVTTSVHHTTDDQGNERFSTHANTVERGLDGENRQVHSSSTDETLDVQATRTKVLAAMDQRRAPLEAQHEQFQNALNKTRTDLASTRKALARIEAKPDEAPGLTEVAAHGFESSEARISRLKQQISRYEAHEAELTEGFNAATDALSSHDADRGGVGDDQESLHAVIQKHGLKVEKQFKKVETSSGKSTSTDAEAMTHTTRDGFSATTEDSVDDPNAVRSRKRERFSGTETVADAKNLTLSRGQVSSEREEIEREDFAGTDSTHTIDKSTTTLDLKNKSLGHEVSIDEKGPGKKERKESVSGDVAFKDGKLVGSAKTSERHRSESGAFKEKSSTTSVDKDGISHNAESSAGQEGDHFSNKTKVSRSGAFKVVVNTLPGDPPTYSLTTTISLGGRLGGEASGSRRGEAGRENSFTDGDKDAKAGLNASGGLSANYTRTRTLTAEEAKSYLASVDAVDAGGAPSSNLPEFGAWAKLKAAAEQNDSGAELASAVGSAGGSKEMRPGESLSLELGADVEGGANASVDGVGATVSGKLAWKRTVSIARGAGDEVVVTVSRVDESGSTVGATASSGHASGGASRTSAASKGEAVKIRLSTKDPSYDSKFDAITGAMSLGQVRELKKRYQADLIAFERTNSESSQDQGNVDLPGVSFKVGDKSAYQDKVSVDKDGGASGSFTGSAGSNADLEVGGLKATGSERSTSITAEVDAGGDTSVDIENKEVERSLTAVDPKLEGDVGDLDKLAKLKTAVQKAETRLSGYRLSTSDLDALVERAGNRVLWEKCANSSAYGAWMGLASGLRSPKADPEWSQIDADQARRLARAKALAKFAQATGPDGAKCLDNALRHWGEGSYSLEQEDLGEGYEWPPSIQAKKATYTQARKDVDGFQARFDGWLDLPDGLAREIDAMESLSHTLTGLQQAIEGANDYADPALRAELLQALSTARSRLRSDHAEFVDGWRVAHGQEPMGTDPLMQGDAERRIGELERMVRGLKADETRLLDEVEEELDALLSFSIDKKLCRKNLAKVDGSYDLWKSKIEELRTQYAARGDRASTGILPARGAHASSSVHAPTPDVARFNRLHQQLNHFDAEAASDAPEGSMLGRERESYEERARSLNDL